MKKKLALAATSIATLAILAGPAALTVAAQDTPQDVRVESGWMKHDKSFKGGGYAFGRHRQLGESRFHGDEDGEQRGRHHKKGGEFGLLKDADFTSEEAVEVREAIALKQNSILEAMRTKMDARIEAMETKNVAVLAAWEIEDTDERMEALEEIREDAKEEQKEIRMTFRETMKIAYETFKETLKSLLGLGD